MRVWGGVVVEVVVVVVVVVKIRPVGLELINVSVPLAIEPHLSHSSCALRVKTAGTITDRGPLIFFASGLSRERLPELDNKHANKHAQLLGKVYGKDANQGVC